MKLLGMALWAAMGSSAFGASNVYDLKMDVLLDGKHVWSPRVVVREGEPAAISQDDGRNGNFVEVVTTEGSIQGRKGILMKFVVGTIGKNGERTVVAKPQVLAKQGERATIGEDGLRGDVKAFSLTVLVKRAAP